MRVIRHPTLGISALIATDFKKFASEPSGKIPSVSGALVRSWPGQTGQIATPGPGVAV